MPTLGRLSSDPPLVASRWDSAGGERIIGSNSYATELETTRLPMSEQEWRVRAHRSATAASDAVVDAATTLVEARASTAFTRHDGYLRGQSGLPDFGAGEGPVSPTQLESYATCPHSYFVQRLLRVEPIEQPEEIIAISALEIGDLMHRAVDGLITELNGRLPSYGEPWTSAHHTRLIEIANALAAEKEMRGLTGHWRLWSAERTRIVRDPPDQMLADDSVWRAGLDAKVVGSEYAFGMNDPDFGAGQLSSSYPRVGSCSGGRPTRSTRHEAGSCSSPTSRPVAPTRISIAAPSEVLVSQTVRDLVASYGLILEEYGTYTLKGAPNEWRLFRAAN